MTILDTLKSLLGLDTGERRPETDEDVGVTVEREPGEEPDASSERSVKGVGEPEDDVETTGETATEEPEGSGAGDESTAEAPEDAAESEAVTGTGTTEPAEEADESGAADEVESAEEPATGAGTDESPDVLEGIGPAYAERLADAGVETVADLATADASTLAEEADVPESRLERWIERARNR